jgi:long-chain acyl-CoA synthetase
LSSSRIIEVTNYTVRKADTESSARWLAMSHGCGSQSISIVTAYDTLGSSGVEHSLAQTQARAMFIDPHLLKTASGPLKKATHVKYLIYNETSIFSDGSEIEPFKKAHPELTILSFEELRIMGEENPVDVVPPSAEDLFCIMYTSGTSGLPKGVPMTHGGILAAGKFVSPYKLGRAYR